MHSIFEIRGINNQIIKGNKWVIDEEIKPTVVIIHGMSEYSYRYNDFSEFLNQKGFDVFALDHMKHGLNTDSPTEVMKWEKDGFFQSVENVKVLIDELKSQGREVSIFAHSMGSFMGQMLIQKYPELVSKIVLCGTSTFTQKGLFTKMFVKMYRIFSGKGYKEAKVINKLTFFSYNAKIKNPICKYDWLSVNKENVKKYNQDPYCNQIPSSNFFSSLLLGLIYISNKKNFKLINKKIRILLVAGKLDPVGKYGKNVKKLHLKYINQRISCNYIIYDGMRHEILNEENHQIVYDDIYKFLISQSI